MKIESITITPAKSATFYCEVGYEYHTFNSYISSSVSIWISDMYISERSFHWSLIIENINGNRNVRYNLIYNSQLT